MQQFKPIIRRTRTTQLKRRGGEGGGSPTKYFGPESCIDTVITIMEMSVKENTFILLTIMVFVPEIHINSKVFETKIH